MEPKVFCLGVFASLQFKSFFRRFSSTEIIEPKIFPGLMQILSSFRYLKLWSRKYFVSTIFFCIVGFNTWQKFFIFGPQIWLHDIKSWAWFLLFLKFSILQSFALDSISFHFYQILYNQLFSFRLKHLKPIKLS